MRIRTSQISEALRTYIQRRLQFSIARFADQLAHVSVRIADTEGASDQRLFVCRVEAEIRPSGGPMVEEVADRDLYTAIDLAADRTGRTLRRTLAWGDGPVGRQDDRRAYDRRVSKPAEEAIRQVAGQHVVQEGSR